MVNVTIEDIPDFPGMPGQRPTPGAPSDVVPVDVVLVTSPLDRNYRNVALNAAVVDAFIAAEILADRAYETQVERWSPWSELQLDLSYADAAILNYARFTIGSRRWYAFLDVEYLNLTTSAFTPTPDIWTTFAPRVGYSQVLRSHAAVAASKNGDTSYCLEPENFTPGELVGYAGYQADPLGTPRVLVISTTDLSGDGFVAVDPDQANTATDFIATVNTSGTIEAPQPVGGDQPFAYAIGSGSYDDLFYYPYAESMGLSPGNTMYRPYARGATPSLIDGVIAEGGAFLYPSIGAAITHLSKIAHTPWISDGIQRIILVPGGSAGGSGAIDLSPHSNKLTITGGPSYQATFNTEIDYYTTLAADWKSGLPSAYTTWTKLRTAPYSSVQIADRLGGTSDYDPQAIVGLGSLRLHFQGVYHPEADVVAWIVGAGGTADQNAPMAVPLGVALPHYAVGRDSVLAAQAAGIAAERSQSIQDMITALQRASADNAFTMASTFTATQFAIAEAV